MILINTGYYRANAYIKNIELEVVKGASHLLPLSKSDYINQKVIDFIR